MLDGMPILVSAQSSIQLISVLSKHLVFGQLSCSSFFIVQSTGSKPIETDRNGPNFRIGQERAGLAQPQYWSDVPLCFVTTDIIYLMKLDDACANHAGSCK